MRKLFCRQVPTQSDRPELAQKLCTTVSRCLLLVPFSALLSPVTSFAGEPLFWFDGRQNTTQVAPIDQQDCWNDTYQGLRVNGCWQNVVGTDAMGNHWPPNFWGANGAAGFTMVVNEPNAPADMTLEDRIKYVNKYVSNDLVIVNSDNQDLPSADNNLALYSDVRANSPISPPADRLNVPGQNGMGGGSTQNTFTITPTYEDPNNPDLYISYWARFEPGMAKNLQGLHDRPGVYGLGTWREIFGFKTGSFSQAWDGNWRGVQDGQYRIAVEVLTYPADNQVGPHAPYFGCVGDNRAGSYNHATYWHSPNGVWVGDQEPDLGGHWQPPTGYSVPVPDGEWFKFEVFWHRATQLQETQGNVGYFWAAVNGQTICEHFGWNKVEGDPINRIMFPVYSGGRLPISQWIEDLQFWNHIPSQAEKDAHP